EQRYLLECLDSTFVSVGPFVQRFEQEFADQVGARYAVACATGTAALHVALLLSGAGPGTEVAVSTLTFVASVNAITYTRARHLVNQAKLPGRGYVHDEVGFNYRLTNLASALGVAQLERLGDFLAVKRRIASRYAKGLVDLPFVPAPEAPWAESSFWLYTV